MVKLAAPMTIPIGIFAVLCKAVRTAIKRSGEIECSSTIQLFNGVLDWFPLLQVMAGSVCTDSVSLTNNVADILRHVRSFRPIDKNQSLIASKQRISMQSILSIGFETMSSLLNNKFTGNHPIETQISNSFQDKLFGVLQALWTPYSHQLCNCGLNDFVSLVVNGNNNEAIPANLSLLKSIGMMLLELLLLLQYLSSQRLSLPAAPASLTYLKHFSVDLNSGDRVCRMFLNAINLSVSKAVMLFIISKDDGEVAATEYKAPQTKKKSTAESHGRRKKARLMENKKDDDCLKVAADVTHNGMDSKHATLRENEGT